MTAQDLKNSILQLAIQGKLVEQRAEEGTAKELLEQIKTEKERLIKEKKIKKEKPLPEITEDEIPFDIPESWKWVRLGEIISYQNGYAYNSMDMSSVNIGYPVIKSGSIMSLKVVIDSKTDYIEEPTEKMLESKILKNDMLMCLSSQSNNPEPLGKTAIYEFDEPALLNQRVLKMKMIFEDMTKFMYYSINSQYFHYTVSHQGGGSAQANLKLEHVLGMQVPIPPIEEQKRIVAKIEELLSYVEQYDNAYSKLEVFNKKFPEDVQKSILQYAIQGKLVEQRPEEGTAEELYQQIQAEKERLIKEGKIKKEKPLSEITEDEIPFEIPESWKWVRLGAIINKLSDGTHSTPKYTSVGIPFISVKDVSSGEIDFSNTKFISEDEHRLLYNRCNPEKGDMLLTKIGTTGIPVIVNTDKIFSLFVSVALLKFSSNLLYDKYLLYAIKSPVAQNQCNINTRGVGNKNWVMRDIANTILPLPPLEEQRRIVIEIEKHLPHCQQLIK